MDFNVDVVAIVGGAIVFIFWLARLEFITKQNSRDIKILWGKHDDFGKEIRTELSSMSKALARIEGRLSNEPSSRKE